MSTDKYLFKNKMAALKSYTDIGLQTIPIQGNLGTLLRVSNHKGIKANEKADVTTTEGIPPSLFGNISVESQKAI